MPSVFLGDNFSLDEPLYLGRPIANRTLIRSICESDQVDRVLVVGNPLSFQSLGLSEASARKITPIASIVDLIGVFRKYNVAAILCSTFGKKFAQLVHFRNINGLECPVYGITHKLSYQDEVGAIYRMMCAGVRATDGILCTSPTAIGVMQRLIARIQETLSFRSSGPSLQETLSFRSSGPSLYVFPLGYEAQTLPSPVVRDSKEFQVLYIGRLAGRQKRICW